MLDYIIYFLGTYLIAWLVLLVILIAALRWVLGIGERTRYLRGLHRQAVAQSYRQEVMIYHLERMELLARGYKLEEPETPPEMPELPAWESFRKENLS